MSNKYSKLAGNTLIFAIGSFGTKILSFFLLRLYTECLSPDEFSTADLLYQTVNVLYPILTLSMADVIIRYGIDKEYSNKKIYTLALTLTLCGLVVFAIFTPFVDNISSLSGYVFILFVYCYFSCFRQLASNFTRALGQVKLFALDGILATFTTLAFNLIFLLWLDLGVYGYIWSIVLSDIFSFLFLTYFARLYKYFDLKSLDFSYMKEILKYALPLIPTYVLWWITAASDRIFVIEMVGETENGIYSAAYKIPNLLLFVTTFFYQAWQMSAIENKDDDGISKFFGKVYSSYSSVLFVGAAGIVLFVRLLTKILVAEEFHEAYYFTPILVLAMVFQCFCQFLSSIYNVKKKTVNSMLTSLSAAVVNIILNFILIPKIGVYGAAIATAAAYFVCFIARIFDVRRLIPFKISHFKFAVNLAIVAYMAFISIFMPYLAYFQLVVLMLVIAFLNLGDILSIVKKVLKR